MMDPTRSEEAGATTRKVTIQPKAHPTFQYHGRVLMVLIPCWIVILSISGRALLGTIGIFAALAAFLFATRSYGFSLLAIVVGITLCNVLQLLLGSTLLSHHVTYLFLLINNTIIMGITGLYLSLMYPHAYMDAMGIAAPQLIEKALFAVLPLPAASLLTWYSISQFGIENSAYYMLSIECCIFLVFGLPLKSSFVKSKVESDQEQQNPNFPNRSEPYLGIQGLGDESDMGSYKKYLTRENEMIGGVKYSELICDETLCYFQCIQLFLPLGLHTFTYWKSTLFVFPASTNEWTSFIDVHILVLVPLLLFGFLGTIGRKSPLWWSKAIRESPSLTNDTTKVYRMLFTLSIALLVPCLEYRVVFFAFGHLLNGLSAPYNYIALTISIYSILAAISIHLRQKPAVHSSSGLETVEISKFSLKEFLKPILQSNPLHTPSYIFSIVAAIGFSAILGIPVYLWFAPVLASLAFINFYFERQWWMYASFVVGIELSLCWFLYKSYWGLEYDFWTLDNLISLKVASFLIVILSGLCASIAGLLILNIFPMWSSVLLVVQAVLLATMEEVLHMEEISSTIEVYPAYLVFMTTVLGLLMTRKLYGDAKISSTILFVVSMIYASKMALLLKPVSWPTISAVILLTPPFYLIYRLWSSDILKFNKDITSNRTIIVYMSWMFAACIWTRYTLIQRLLEVIAGEIHDHAAPALVNGLAFIIFGSSLPPLAWQHPLEAQKNDSSENSSDSTENFAGGNKASNMRKRRRLITFSGFILIALGFTMITSQQLFGGAAPTQIVGTGVMSSILGTRSGIPLLSGFALLALLIVTVLVMTGTFDVENSIRQRIWASLSFGLAAGTFLAPFVMSHSITGIHTDPDERVPLFTIFGVANQCECVAIFVALANWKKLKNLYSVVNVADNASNESVTPKYKVLKGKFDQLGAIAGRLAIIAYILTWLQWPLLLGGTLLLTLFGVNSRMDEIITYNLALAALQIACQLTIAFLLKMNEPAESSPAAISRPKWIADVANIATFSAFGMAVVLNWFLKGSEIGTIMLCPILLLLQPWGTFKAYIPKKNIYLPPLVGGGMAIGISLSVRAMLAFT